MTSMSALGTALSQSLSGSSPSIVPAPSHSESVASPVAEISPQQAPQVQWKSGGHDAPAPSPSAEDLQKLVTHMQDKVAQTSPDLRFSVDQGSGRTVVTVSDRTTKEVIWQFPSEEALQVSREIDQFQKGVLLNRKV